jgi:hypothetical protein
MGTHPYAAADDDRSAPRPMSNRSILDFHGE